MKKIILTLLFLCSLTFAFAQQTEETAIKTTINNLFDGMRKADTTLLCSAFAKDMVLQSISTKNGTAVLTTESADDFVKSIAKPHKEIYDERITINDLKIDGELAMVWAPYKFYIGQTFSHCGVDAFQLMKTTAGWKIIYIADTRRKDNCVE